MMRPSLRETVSLGFFAAIPPMSAVWPAIRASKTWLPYGYRAEMTAAFTCATLGITPTVRHADYIGSWLEVLREDDRAIVRAASAASKAAEFLLAFRPATVSTDAIAAAEETEAV